METTLTLLLSFLLVSSCRGKDDSKNDMTPNFNVLEKSQDFEKRQYDPTTWFRTKITGTQVTDFIKANNRLKSFVRDAQGNTQGLDDLDKTWPVVVNHTKDNQLWLSWFVPPRMKLSSDNAEVEILDLPTTFFYVRKFSGSPSIEAGKENAKKLLSSLGRSCPNLDLVEYSGAGYSSFFSLQQRNEVWINEDSSCEAAV